MNKTMIIVEFADDCPAAIRLYSAQRQETFVVAATPDACETLESQKIPYRMPFKRTDIPVSNAMMTEHISRAHQWSEWMRTQIAGEAPQAAQISFNPVRCCMTSILSFFNAYGSRVYALRQLVEELKPQRVIFFRPAPLNLTPLVLQPGESAWGEIGYGIQMGKCRPSWMSAVACDVLASSATPESCRKRIRQNYPAWYWMRRWLVMRKMDCLSFLAHLRTRGKPRASTSVGSEITMIMDTGYELPWLIREAKHRPNIKLEQCDLKASPSDHTPVDLGLPAWNRIKKRLLEGTDAGHLFTWEGMDWRPAMGGKLSAFFEIECGRIWNQYCAARESLAGMASACAVHEEIGHQDSKRTWLEGVASLNIPTFFYQWGGGYGYYVQPFIEVNELQSNFALTYTPTVADTFNRQVNQSTLNAKSQAISVGSPYFAQLSRQLQSAASTSARPERIFYLSSSLAGLYWYGPNLNLEDTLQFQFQKIILAGLVSWGQLPVTLKLHPSMMHAPDPLQRWIKRTGLGINISSEPLPRLLKPEHVYVIDYPSTIFQQILVGGGRTVYVNTGNVNFYEEAVEPLKRSCLMVEGWADDFDQQIASALTRIQQGWKPETSAFLKPYVNADKEPPQVLAKRAIETILEKTQAAYAH